MHAITSFLCAVGLAICFAGAWWPSLGEGAERCHTPIEWMHACTLQAPKLEPGAFGAAVAWSEGRLWIGPSRDADLGEGPPQVWALGLAAEDRSCVHTPLVAVTHPRGDRHAAFGAALAACGPCAVIGAPAAGCSTPDILCDSGEAWLARPAPSDPPTAWSLTQLWPRSNPASSEAGAAFGQAVAMDGRWIVVASPRADAGAYDAGAVDVYDRDHGDECVTRLFAPQPSASGWFGTSVAVSGNWIAIGEPGHDGAAQNSGCVHLYLFTNGVWTLHESLRAPASAIGWHGAAVALAGDVLLVGAPLAERADGARGVLACYRLQGTDWRLERVIAPSADGHCFGNAVCISPDGTRAAIGSSADSSQASFGGAAWIACLQTGAVERLRCPAPMQDQGLGAGICIGRDVLVVASHGDPELSPPAPGLVHVLVACPTPHSQYPRPP